MIETAALRERFRAWYGGTPRLFRAPGRVNIIGEHTDYNDGFVLPMALELDTVVAAAPRPGAQIVATSEEAGETVTIDLARPGPRQRGTWVDYVEGVVRALQDAGVAVPAASLVIAGDVPLGSGLSSSASLEVSVALALTTLAGGPVDHLELARAGQRAEHEYVGTQCGIMDQYAAAFASAGHALLLDCRSLEARRVPIADPGVRFVVTDSGVRHALAGSEYNERREQCAAAVRRIAEIDPVVRSLRDVAPDALPGLERVLGPVLFRRTRHVVTENVRTLAAAVALSSGDAPAAGRLMDASHASLRDDYEVSCPELDLLAELAHGVPGVFGSRMTGGGFGGSTVTLVAADAVDDFARSVLPAYRQRTGREAVLRVVTPGAGASEIAA